MFNSQLIKNTCKLRKILIYWWNLLGKNTKTINNFNYCFLCPCTEKASCTRFGPSYMFVISISWAYIILRIVHVTEGATVEPNPEVGVPFEEVGSETWEVSEVLCNQGKPQMH